METVYRFKAALKYRRGLWRRIEIKGSQTLGELDRLLREAFQHDLSDHLSEFFRKGEGLGALNPFEATPAARLKLHRLGLAVGERLGYVYDFGDWIEHVVTLEQIGPPEPGVTYPRVVAQNKPRYRRCAACAAKGIQATATWICIECSNEQQKDVLLCDGCVEDHEDHYTEEMIY